MKLNSATIDEVITKVVTSIVPKTVHTLELTDTELAILVNMAGKVVGHVDLWYNIYIEGRAALHKTYNENELDLDNVIGSIHFSGKYDYVYYDSKTEIDLESKLKKCKKAVDNG